jgi:tetratricopeptide (TPR) repeat protein
MGGQGCPRRRHREEYIEEMHRFGKILCGLLFIAVCLALPASARADTIVLKNGRRIAALSVTMAGDKIQYETASGTLTLPRSIVDHIERGGGDLAAVGGDKSDFALKPPEASPAISPNETEITQRVLHDAAIDRAYIAALEREARSGTAEANQDAAIAHHAAAQFALSRGDVEQAFNDARSALTYAPEQPALLLDIAYFHLRRSEYTQSLEYIDRARRITPDDPEIAKLAGWAYYRLNKIDKAVAEWKRSQALRADPEVEAALKKAEKDIIEEEQYKENESSHFKLRYSGAAEPSLARDVLRVLERHYTAIDSELNYTPPDSIGVILYTQQAFADITQAPQWVGALNDGRIRVPVQGLAEVTPELSRVLKHELTHSFIQQKSHGLAPTWMQEGIAQWLEGKRSGANAAALVKLYETNPALVKLVYQGGWMKLPTDAAGAMYAWALADIEYIVQANGMGDVDRILGRIAAGEPPEEALKAALRMDYAELTGQAAEYLRKAYRN